MAQARTIEPTNKHINASSKRTFTRILFVSNMENDPESDIALREHSEDVLKILNSRMPTTLAYIKTPRDLENALSLFSPMDTLVFNWSEDFPGYAEGLEENTKIIEQHGFAHTGSNQATLKLVSDRAGIYRMLREMGILAPRYLEVYSPPDVKLWTIYPVLIRPNEEHGALGLKQAKSPEEAEKIAGELMNKFSPPALMVEYIKGREFSVGMWSDGHRIQPFPVLERDFTGKPDDINDKEDDTTSDTTSFSPSNVPPKNIPLFIVDKMVNQSIQIFTAFGIKITGRVDWRLARGAIDPVCIDVNPEPFASKDSEFMAMGAKGWGMTHEQLILGILDRAIAFYAPEPISVQEMPYATSAAKNALASGYASALEEADKAHRRGKGAGRGGSDKGTVRSKGDRRDDPEYYVLMDLSQRLARGFMHDDPSYDWSRASDAEINKKNQIAEFFYDKLLPIYRGKRGAGAMWLRRQKFALDNGQPHQLGEIMRAAQERFYPEETLKSLDEELDALIAPILHKAGNRWARGIAATDVTQTRQKMRNYRVRRFRLRTQGIPKRYTAGRQREINLP
jgi:D-alanine-D-alanine ligase